MESNPSLSSAGLPHCFITDFSSLQFDFFELYPELLTSLETTGSSPLNPTPSVPKVPPTKKKE